MLSLRDNKGGGSNENADVVEATNTATGEYRDASEAFWSEPPQANGAHSTATIAKTPARKAATAAASTKQLEYRKFMKEYLSGSSGVGCDPEVERSGFENTTSRKDLMKQAAQAWKLRQQVIALR
jgi:hypothetical protein